VQSGDWPAQETAVPLFPYQREGMLHLAFTERALLADEMGLGKTIQAIAACALLHRLGKARRVLVVTPASLKTEWEEQICRFPMFAGALAVEHRLPEPIELKDALQPPLSHHWGEALLVIRAFVEKPGSDWKPVADCVAGV
jgi:superfamily II DNA or RNA helicase